MCPHHCSTLVVLQYIFMSFWWEVSGSVLSCVIVSGVHPSVNTRGQSHTNTAAADHGGFHTSSFKTCFIPEKVSALPKRSAGSSAYTVGVNQSRSSQWPDCDTNTH